MNTYFNFQQEIFSKDVSEAISLPTGFGPVYGFGCAVISTQHNTIKIYPDRSASNMYENYLVSKEFNEVNDLSGRRHYGTSSGHCCITKDSTIATFLDSIEVPISNIKGYKDEVIVFAQHAYIPEPIDNPVSFVAYWNNSDISFFDLYKKTQDIYYPTEEVGRAYDFESNDPLTKKEFTYKYLLEQVYMACPEDRYLIEHSTLIGIYGTGVDVNTNVTENFAIVPYLSKFPMNIPYNVTIHNSITRSLSNMERKFRDMLDYDTVKAYIDAKIQSIVNELDTNQIPSGTIVLWAGTVEDIPEGWELYTPAQGKIVVGWQNGGISVKGKKILQTNGTTTDDSSNAYKGSGENDWDWNFTLDRGNTPLPWHNHTHWHDHTYDHRHIYPGNNGLTYGNGASQYSPTTDLENAGADGGTGRVVWTSNANNAEGHVFTSGPVDGYNNEYNSTSGPENDGGASGDGMKTTLNFSKLPPAVTLMYIRKK